jgi:predicted site-specific integrase-resolvase
MIFCTLTGDTMNSAVLYARVSSKDQEQEGYSIPAQIKMLHEYASRKSKRQKPRAENDSGIC